MTDEELADKYAEEHFGKKTELVEVWKLKSCKENFLAGLKAGRPQWHDLRKDKTDLPKDEKDMLMSEQLILLTKMKGTDNLNISIGQYNFSTQEFSYPHFIGLTDVIAWCEIPTFDKE